MNDVDAINVVSDDEECDAVLLIQKHCRKLYWVLRKKKIVFSCNRGRKVRDSLMEILSND